MKPRDIQETTSSNACTELDRRKWMKDVQTIAVKIGSSVLMDDNGRLEPEIPMSMKKYGCRSTNVLSKVEKAWYC